MLNTGVMKDDGKISITPLEVLKENVIYEKEVFPGVFRHVINVLKEKTDMLSMKKALNILRSLPFNNERTRNALHFIIFSGLINR